MRDPVYGHVETNSIPDGYHEAVTKNLAETVELDDPRLARIVRLRLVTDPGFPFFDLSYCHGQLRDGTFVRVQLPQFQFSKRELNRELIAMCKAAGVYGKALGIFDPEVVSKLYG